MILRQIIMLTSALLEFLLISFSSGKYCEALRLSNNGLSDSKPLSVGLSENLQRQSSTSTPNYLSVSKFRSPTQSALFRASTTTLGKYEIIYATTPVTTSAPRETLSKSSFTPGEEETIIRPTTFSDITGTTTSPTSRRTITTEAPAEFQCNCSSVGSLDDCDRLTGQCLCLAGYTGKLCQDCLEDHFTNGSSGCLPCHCNASGSLGERCNSSGVCVCKTGVSGERCDGCRPGYFGFSEGAGCQPCQCHNHSTYCSNQTGVCLNCQGNTRGPRCEECKFNFYRRPGAGPREACLPCPCSSVTSTTSCHIDRSGQPACDQCRPEYRGSHCDECRDGFFNSDSICVSCNCSGNADPLSLPRLCDPETGRCLSCANNTGGENCERCAEGYAGDALAHSCTPEVLPTTLSPETSMTSTRTPQTSASALTFRPNATANATTPGVPSTSIASTAPTTAAPAPPTTLLSPLANTTAALGAVSWSQFNIVVLSVIIAVLLVLMGVAGAVYTFREYRNRKVNAPFWTIELKEDNVSFSSYHDNLPDMDVAGLLDEEEVNEEAAPPHVRLSVGSAENMFQP